MIQMFVGALFLIVGAALSVLPGPGLPFILAGLVMLAPYSTTAQRALTWLDARVPDSVRELAQRYSPR